MKGPSVRLFYTSNDENGPLRGLQLRLACQGRFTFSAPEKVPTGRRVEEWFPAAVVHSHKACFYPNQVDTRATLWKTNVLALTLHNTNLPFTAWCRAFRTFAGNFCICLLRSNFHDICVKSTFAMAWKSILCLTAFSYSATIKNEIKINFQRNDFSGKITYYTRNNVCILSKLRNFVTS